MAELVLPNGQTISTNNPAEIAEFMSRGAQNQSDAVAASPGSSIQEVANQRGQTWNSPGGQGYQHAMEQGYNDPTSDPAGPQKFDPSTLADAGVDPQAYYDKWFQGSIGGDGVSDWGIDDNREAFNQQLYQYAQSKGYSPDIGAFGPDQGGQFQQWLRYQPEHVQYDLNQWIQSNNPGTPGGGTPGGIFQPGTPPQNPGDSYEPRDYGHSVRNATPAGLAAYYKSQGMQGRPYGTSGGEHNFFPNLDYLLPEIVGMDSET